MTVLVVAHSLTVRMDLAETFAEAGFDARACASVAEARQVLSAEAPALVVLDAEGLAWLDALRADPATTALPILALGGDPGGARADAVVDTPYDRAHLLATARALLASSSHAPRRKVLVIDDSLTFREAMRAALEAEGYDVTVAASGEEGLGRAASLRPDAVVVDGSLPGIDGVTVLRHIRLDAALRRTPCLLLTGSDGAMDELAALEAGADAFARKHDAIGLVLARLAALLRSAESPAGRDEPDALGGRSLLLVDDGRARLEALASTLVAEGYDVTRVASAEQALARLAEGAIDGLLVSVQLPGGAALAVCRRVKGSAEWRHVPLLMVGDAGDQAGMIESFNAGADDYLPHDEAPEVVKGRLRAQLRRKAFEDENRRHRETAMRRRLEVSEAEAAQALADTRAALLADLERKNAELEQARASAEAAARSKAEFLAHMSHEIRTPLSALIGSADLLCETPLTPEQHRYVGLFRRGGENLLRVVNDVLDLSKLDAGSLTLEQAPFDLLDLIERTLEITALRAHEKGIELVGCVPTAAAWPVSGDAYRLSQVLQNLVVNAVKFTDEGEVALSVAPWPEGPEGMVVFRVTDTGIGLPEDQLEAVFGAFVQADSSTSRRYGGTGLGLTICRRLVAMMGGRIWAEQRAGGGSIFCFTAMLPGRPTAIADAPMAGARMLVADDNAAARRGLVQLLSAWGADVHEAEGGEAAWQLLEEAPYDWVLLDGRMPGLDGLTLLERLHAEGRLPAGTVVLATVDALAATGARMATIGVSACLPKPVRRDELRAAFDARHDAPGPEARAIAPVRKGLRILLAEDTPDNRVIFRAFMERTPHRMDMVEHGRAAVERFRQQAYDVVLMDMHMPVMDGYAATRAIRAWEAAEGRAPTPILALTAFALAEEIAKTREAGCDGHLTKPIQQHQLLDALDAITVLPSTERPTVAIDASLASLLPDFLANRRLDLVQLDEAVAAGDWPAVASLAHRFTGMGSTYGIDRISDAGRALTEGAGRTDAAHVRRAIAELKAYLASVEIVFVDEAP